MRLERLRLQSCSECYSTFFDATGACGVCGQKDQIPLLVEIDLSEMISVSKSAIVGEQK